MEIETTNGGPAFPVPGLQHDDGFNGMTLRQYYAGQLMQGELLTCGVPGEACDALVAKAAELRMDPVDVMAVNAMEGADALIRASAIPPQRVEQPFDPAHLTNDERAAMNRLKDWIYFDDLPVDIRDRVGKTALFLEREDSNDSIPF